MNDIVIDERIRKDLDETGIKELAESMLRYTQLQPVILEVRDDGKMHLVAGERRIRAIQYLTEQGRAVKGGELGKIHAEYLTGLSEHTRLFIEFDENMKRKDFDFVEKSRFIRRFHETLEAKADGKWTAELTAVTLGLSNASISHYLRIEEAMKSDPLVAKATTMKSAIKRMKIVEHTQVRKIAAQNSVEEHYKKASEILKLGNAVELIKEIADESMDMVNFDPPWGEDVGHKSTQNWESFDDTQESADDLVEELLPELYRVLKNDRFLICWYRIRDYTRALERLTKAGFDLGFNSESPCIWYKPEKTTDQNRFPEKMLLTSYETFIIARKGVPMFHERNVQDVFAYERTQRGELIHPTEKPIALNTKLIKMCTVPGEKVLDPTAGSASFLHAAIAADRKALGFELEQGYHDRAVLRLTELLKERREV